METNGIHGISFSVQSAEYSPVFLEAKIIGFIDHFYHNLLTHKLFYNF